MQTELIDDDSISPFKRSEKLYKKFQGHATNFTNVLDFDDLDANNAENRARIHGIKIPSSEHPENSTVYSVDGHRGLFILPRFLTQQSQLEWARRCLEVLPLQHLAIKTAHAVLPQEYPEPPNLTNLNPHFGELRGIWRDSCRGDPSAAKMLRSLRWCTLGYQARPP